MPNPPSPDTNGDDWEERLFGGYKRQWWAGAEVYRMGSTLDEPVPEAGQKIFGDPHSDAAIRAFNNEYLGMPVIDTESSRQQVKTELFRHAYGKSNILPEMYRRWKLDQAQDKAALLALLKGPDRYRYHIDVKPADDSTTPPNNTSAIAFTSATQGDGSVVDSNDVHSATHNGATQHTFTVEIPGVDQGIVDEYQRNLETLRDVYDDQFKDVVLPEQTEEALREFNENFRRNASHLYSSPDVVKTTDLLGMLLVDTTGPGFHIDYWSLHRYDLKDMGNSHQALGIPVGCDGSRNIVIRKAGKNYPHVVGHEWHIDHTQCGFSLIIPAFPSYERANRVAEQLVNNCQWGLSGYEPREIFNSFPAHMGEYMQYMTRRDVDFEDYQTWLLHFRR